MSCACEVERVPGGSGDCPIPHELRAFIAGLEVNPVLEGLIRGVPQFYCEIVVAILWVPLLFATAGWSLFIPICWIMFVLPHIVLRAVALCSVEAAAQEEMCVQRAQIEFLTTGWVFGILMTSPLAPVIGLLALAKPGVFAVLDPMCAGRVPTQDEIGLFVLHLIGLGAGIAAESEDLGGAEPYREHIAAGSVIAGAALAQELRRREDPDFLRAEAKLVATQRELDELKMAEIKARVKAENLLVVAAVKLQAQQDVAAAKDLYASMWGGSLIPDKYQSVVEAEERLAEAEDVESGLRDRTEGKDQGLLAAAAGAIGGFLVGGPIGAAVGGGVGYFVGMRK